MDYINEHPDKIFSNNFYQFFISSTSLARYALTTFWDPPPFEITIKFDDKSLIDVEYLFVVPMPGVTGIDYDVAIQPGTSVDGSGNPIPETSNDALNTQPTFYDPEDHDRWEDLMDFFNITTYGSYVPGSSECKAVFGSDEDGSYAGVQCTP